MKNLLVILFLAGAYVQTLQAIATTHQGPPRNLRIASWGPTFVKLQWDPPRNASSKESLNYLFKLLSSEIFSSYRETNQTEILLENLQPSTDYKFAVMVSTDDGPWSNTVPFRISDNIITDAPKNVKVLRKSPTTLEVSWDPIKNRPVSGYRVDYKIHNDNPDSRKDLWDSVEISDGTTVDIKGLKSNQVYVIRVTGKDQYGNYGEMSDIVLSTDVRNDQNILQHVLKRLLMYTT